MILTITTNLEKYGDISPQKDPEVRKKQKITNIKKYGYSCTLLNIDVKEKSKKTLLEKYGVEHYSKSDNYKEKYKQTSIDRYGVEHPSQSNLIQEKMKKTCMDRFGVDSYFKTSEYKEKFKKTMIDKYGVDNYFKYEKFKIEMREELIKNGFNVCSEDIGDWSRYKRTCLTLSYKNYKNLKILWNGYDYYDNEYIKDNYIKFNSNNQYYPTVDHKISILYGYLNDISPEEISNIDNLCITKKCINSSKNSLIESVFMKMKFKGEN